MAMLDVDNASFDTEVLQSDLPVLVDFWAPWCNPCKAFMPTVEKVAAETEGKLKVVKIDVDSNPELANRFQVRSIPTLVVMHQGEMQDMRAGSMTATDLNKFVQPFV